MKKVIAIIMSLFFIQGCEAQSKMPKEMPEKFRISFNESGGMMRAYKKIEIKDGALEIEELRSGQRDPQIRTFKISREDLAALYRVFAENKFDTIKNDERKEIVHDAGSERITIAFEPAKFFGVTYGRNTPLSGQNLKRYQAVRKALDELVARAQIPSGSEPGETDPEKFIQGKWRVAGERGGHAWYLEWTFDQGTFRQMGYPPILQEGKYKALETNGVDKITLELYDQTGTFGTEKGRLEIVIDRENNQLNISGTNGFLRLPDEK